MNSPLVSIIIPYYNRPDKLERCLNSIDSQTYTNYEIIVVDDCSSIPFKVRHSHVQYLKNKVNSGPGVSRNLGMNNATGDFYAFLDCDDYWHSHFLDVLVRELNSNSNAVMAYSLGYNVDAAERVIGDHRKTKKKDRNRILPDILFSGRVWGTGACLWRANSIKDVKWISARSWEDYAFEVAVAVRHNNIIFVNQNLVYFDDSSDNKLSNQNAKIVATEKNKSILDISNTLINAGFENYPVIRKSTTILVLLSIIKLKKFKIYNLSILFKNIKSLKKWRTKRFSYYVLILYFLPRKFCVKYLTYLKQRVNQDRIQFLGK